MATRRPPAKPAAPDDDETLDDDVDAIFEEARAAAAGSSSQPPPPGKNSHLTKKTGPGVKSSTSRPGLNTDDSAGPAPKAKRLAPSPVTIREIFEGCVLDIARAHHFTPVRSKVTFTFCLVMATSLVAHNIDFESKADRYSLTHRNNFFNIYFVKWGWAWTLFAVAPFVYFTAAIYCAGDRRAMFRHFARLIIATTIWFVLTTTFATIERRTRVCTVGRKFANSKFDCVVAGGTFYSYDISGHCFILIYSILLMAEEASAFYQWGRLTKMVEQQRVRDPSAALFLDPYTAALTSERLTTFRPFIKIWFAVFLLILSGIWYWCLLVTCLFYHNIIHKILGAVIAITCWAVTYRGWFLLERSPGLPGQGGIFRYQVGGIPDAAVGPTGKGPGAKNRRRRS